MKKILLLFIFIIAAAIPIYSIAGGDNKDSSLHTKVTQWVSNTGGLRFLENKGQMTDEQRKPVSNVLYEVSSGGMNVYVTTSGLSYVFVKLEKHPNGSPWDKRKSSSAVYLKGHNDSITETYCRADMNLVGADIRKENIVQEGESEDRSDYYYGGICPDGVLGVHTYEKLTIKNIYPGIDWVLHGGKQGLKYDFIVHPGADPSQIKLKYKWTDKPQLQEDGSIKISTPMGNITEGTPVSYCNNEQVQTTYTVKDSVIHFQVSDYNSAQTLIIDPKLVWATYYGSGIIFNDVSYMQEDGNNVWLVGRTYSLNFPTFNPGNGVYFQGTLPGVINIFILKFSVAGVLKWATYYGGSKTEVCNSIYSDGKNVWLTGYSQSTNFPTLNPGGGAYFQPTSAGAENAFILQFDTAGVRKWATYYGGNNAGFEGGASICSDSKNVWVAGYTSSPNFPTLNPGGGAYFQGTRTGSQNAFVLKFNTTGVLRWATYYGGNSGFSGEGASSISSDGTHVWVTGETSSTNFPILNPGGGAYFQGAIGASQNSFILQFDTGAVRIWATYYGGSLGDDALSISGDGTNVWLTGIAQSPDLPTLNPGGGAYFQGTLPGTQAAFISQFNTAGILKWATYYGGSTTDAGYSIQSDGANVWVCGSTQSADFPTLNSGCGFYQDTVAIVKFQCVFILQFNTSGVRKWATYYGSDFENDDSYISSDGVNLFVAGDAQYPLYPTVNPGGGAYFHDTNLVYGSETVFIGKFVPTGFSANSMVSICRGGATTLKASGAISYHWSPPTGLSDTNTANPVASPTVTTTYIVKGIDTGACSGAFIDSVKVVVDTLGRLHISNDTSICSGSSVTLHALGGGTYTWNTGAITSSISITNDTVTRTYTVNVTNGACQKDTLVKVMVVPLPKPVITGTPLKCLGVTDTLMVSSSVNPTTYKWGNGSTSTAIITSIITSDTTIYVTAYNSLGCPVKDTIDVTVKLPPAVTVNPPTIACSGTEVVLKADTKGAGPFTYTWTPGGKTTDTVTVNPNVTTSYSVVVSNGCITTKTTIVIPDNPTLSACCDHIIFTGDDTVLVAKSPSAKSYQWSPSVNCLNPLCDSVKVMPVVTTTYTVTSTDSAGCQLERIVTIVVENPCSDFPVPNVFTPNYKGINESNNVFYIKTQNMDLWDIIIYDRWGKEMFHSTNPAQYWDGNTEGGSKAPDGVYYYIINATCQNTSYKKDGFLQLIR